ncbi:MAG: [FeFe] hydrogenase H-cluster radical SAM maturase HydE [Thermodesulfobacteriota bacterium]
MCYAIPGRVVDIANNIAVIDYFGERKEAYADLEEVKVGDFVYAQGGLVVQTIAEGEAEGILDGWRETFFRLKERDRELSEGALSSEGGDSDIAAILKRAEAGAPLERDELLALLRCDTGEDLGLIYRTANRVRRRVHGNSCCVHGIIEFSNFCRNDCAYCGIRSENSRIERYRMEIGEIVDVACRAVDDLGFKALVLQSGEDDHYTTERLVEIVRMIRERCGVLLIMSIGERNRESYEALYDAGARGILMRFETSNPHLYESFHRTCRYVERVQALREVREIGYIVATGSIIGLPGQTGDDLVNDIELAGSLDAEMYSFGPLVPHPETPLGGAPPVEIDTLLGVIAVMRLLNHDGNILVTSAVKRLFGREGTERGLMAGGNSLMVNLTPREYRERYAIYPGKGSESDDVRGDIAEKLALLASLGRAPTDIGIGGLHG